MIVQREMLLQTKAFGLNSYESKLWTALLAKGSATAGELSDMANVPRSRAYDVLESLEKKGFIIMKIGKPIKYIAIPPEAVLERVKKRITLDAEEKTKMLSKLKDTELITELSSLYKNGIDLVEPFELSGSLKGRKSIYEYMEQIIKSSNKTINITTTQSGLLRKKDAFIKILKKAKDRGVKIRINAPLNSLNQEIKDCVADLKNIVELRHTETKARLCIVDSANVIFMVTDDEHVNPSFDSAIWINSPFFASTLDKIA